MANLPRAVQRQVEEAEAMLAATQKSPEPSEVASEQPESTPAAEAPQINESPTQEVAPAPQQAPETVNWEHKFKTLQGIFNAEVPKLQQQNKELSVRLQEALDRLEKLTVAQQQAQPQQPTLDPKDVENFGQDLVEMVQRQTRAVLSQVANKVDAVIADFERRIAALEQAVKGTTQTLSMTAEEVFFSNLTQAVPDWEQINADERFLGWLAEIDPVYGQPRQAALTAAQQALDVRRVAAIFNTFKSQIAKPTKQDSLAKQVSPKNAASAPPPASAEKPVITQQQVQAFYHDLAVGKYRGREAEAKRLEQMINEALAEGRIQ